MSIESAPLADRPWLCRRGFHLWGRSTPSAYGWPGGPDLWDTRCRRRRCRARLCLSIGPFR